MGIFDRFPYSSTHEMNLDFMLGKATEIAESLQEIDTHKEQAEQAATNAAQSAQSAAQAAQAAAGSQTAAGTSASQAAQHKADAEDAADRAEAASDLADEAVEQAQTAAQTAGTAAQNASTAADGAIASAAAAETRINNLAASLPEDFTELNNEVNDLKNTVEEIITTEQTEQEITITRTDNGAWRFLNNVYTFTTGGAFASFTTKVFPAESLAHYKAHAAKYSTCPPIVVTDANGNVLTAFGYDSEQGYSFTIIDIEFDTPANSANIWLLYPYTSAQVDDYKLIKETSTQEINIPDIYKTLNRNITPEPPYESVTGAVAWNGSNLELRNASTYKGWTTKKYSVTPGEKIHVRGTYFNTNPFGAFVDNSNNLTPIWYNADNTGYNVKVNEKTVTVPEGCTNVYLSYYSTWPGETQAQLWKFTYGQRQKWAGRKWVCIGDSLTEYNAAAGMKYYDFVQCYTGIEPINLGKGGTGYMNPGSTETFYNRINEIPESFDIITIFGSGNDLSYPLGNPTDSGTETICGCINKTIDDIYASYPLAKLGIITPCPWASYPTSTNNAMARYANALVQICNLRGIPCLDLYRTSGFRPWEDAFRTRAYTVNNSDGVHPNNTGNEILASHFLAFIDQLLL